MPVSLDAKDIERATQRFRRVTLGAFRRLLDARSRSVPPQPKGP